MPTEIELKLRLPAAQAARLLRHPLLQGVSPMSHRLGNTYYDTPALDLWQRGIALRQRHQGDSWLTTVKGGDPAIGGLARRKEWEAPALPGVFDFSIVADAGLRRFLEERGADLQAVFSTDFRRQAWTLRRGAMLIELALDRGWIVADGRREAICELELELVEGESTDSLFDLAIELATDLRLHPSIASKAERGYALSGKRPYQPVPASLHPPLSQMAPVEAFRSLALDCLTQLQRNEDGALIGRDAEFRRQMRAAVRRLLAAFDRFAPVLSADFVAVYAPRWLKLAAALDGGPPGEGDDSGQAALRGREYGRLLLAFSAALLRVAPPGIGADGKA